VTAHTHCKRLEDKVVLVTGSTKGFGAAMARRFAAEGARAIITGRSEPEGNKLEAEIRDAGGTATFVQADLTDETSVRDLVATAAGLHGRLDSLVNNAMAMDQVGANERPLADMDTNGLNRIINVGIYGLFWACKYAIPHLLTTGGGTIVNISSLAAVAGVPSLPAYTMCKGAMGSLTRQLATDYGPRGLRINTMICGIVLAEGLADAVASHPVAGAKMAEGQLTRYGSLDDIAGLATYLVSDESGFVNGAELRIDGGWTSTARFPNLVDLVLADLAPQS
jgi:NAD(P)-dependent dehydrogenase (short-subunit alcohol dehydrogenase family)